MFVPTVNDSETACLKMRILMRNENLGEPSAGIIWELSKPKLNLQLNSTEFEVRLHSYREVNPTNPPTTQTLPVVDVVKCPASRQGPQSLHNQFA